MKTTTTRITVYPICQASELVRLSDSQTVNCRYLNNLNIFGFYVPDLYEKVKRIIKGHILCGYFPIRNELKGEET
jgi:hypothetical protein